VEIAKFAGFNSPQLAELGLNLLFFRPNAESLNTTERDSQQFIYLSKIIANFSF
jgi:hypothetical protein